jgi:hypothetical protein
VGRSRAALPVPRHHQRKQVIQNLRSGVLKVEEVPEPLAPPGGVLVQNVASLISAGTEKMAIDLARSSLIGKARQPRSRAPGC